MQRVNFLAKEYRLEPVRNEEMIGICDPEGERPAYSTSVKNSPDKWVATIKNEEYLNIQFRSQTHFRLAPQATIEIKSFGKSNI